MKKQCFKCGQKKPLKEFYKHPQMGDGHLNKCKECSKKDVKENRKNKLEYYREYDRERGNRQTPEYRKNYDKRFPQKAKARRMVAYHMSKGSLVREACEVCGSEERTHAHHDDYAKPLNVRWLCPAHHREWHKKNGPGLNGK